jgi:hypothetical protein
MMRNLTRTPFHATLFLLLCAWAGAASAVTPYAIGTPVLKHLYVSPTGKDSNSGLSATAPLKTLGAAWNKIPSTLKATGYRVNLLPGTYTCEPAEPDDCQNFLGNRHGSFKYPVILSAYRGKGTVTVRGGLNIANVDYLYLINLNLVGGYPLPVNSSGNNLLHLDHANHVLLRGLTVDGPDCDNDTCNNLQEVLKVNQARGLYVENSTIGGAWHTAVDYFVVQGGHFIKNKLHTAGQWCMYLKGGTAYLRIEGNVLEHCQLGFQAGQSANMAMMRLPYVHYDTYGIKFVNNVLRHLPGVGISAAGAYDLLVAYNTLYDVATTTDAGAPLFQATYAERGCNRTDEQQNPAPVCQAMVDKGAWGPNIETDNLPSIPSKNVYVYNNLFYNAAPAQTLYTQFSVDRWIDLPAGFQNLPKKPASDTNLVLAGNVIWNGPAGFDLGINSGTGCAPTNPACNPAQLVRDNAINAFEPQLFGAATGDYHPKAGGNLFAAHARPIPAFTWASFRPAVPAGNLSNAVTVDFEGAPRVAGGPPGAYAKGK